MPAPIEIHFHATDGAALLSETGRIAVLVSPKGKMPAAVERLDKAAHGALSRALDSAAWSKLKVGEAMDLAWPAGLKAEAVQLVKLPAKAGVADARKAGAAIARGLGAGGALVVAGAHPQAAEVSFGLALRAYEFSIYRTGEKAVKGAVRFFADKPEKLAAEAAPLAAVAEGVLFTRDLINEPANVLTTSDFAARLAAMQELGLDVEILDEPALEKLGMRALLAVGQGSESPSKLVVMQWRGGKKGQAPLALVGKGVVFDTGGISIKPAQGMEEMTMDMGGAGVVAGVMRTLALRKARANVVGLVGIVKTCPTGGRNAPAMWSAR